MDISTVSFELLLVYFFFGLGVLTIGAHWFVEGAVSLSVRLGIPKIIIGSVVMSLATTSPEVIVSIVSVLKHQEKIALGNIFGSFVANLGLVLGISGLIRPITVSYVILHRQLPFVIGALGVLVLLSLGSYIENAGAGVLVAVFFCWAGWLISHMHSEKAQIALPEAQTPLITMVWFILGVAAMQIGAYVMVSAAEGLAESMGVSPYVIGVSIVAVGTSLPELASGIYGAIKGEYELVLGNILGANILLITFVLPLVVWLSPEPVMLSGAFGDYWFMGCGSVLAWIFSTCFDNSWKINRYEAFLLLLLFVGYQLFSYR